MNLTDPKYSRFALVREMMETPGVIRDFDSECAMDYADRALDKRGIFMTGEGSSRIFPAKRAISYGLRTGSKIPVFTEGATQAMEYDLSEYAIFGASNSGRTKELIRLFTKWRELGHDTLFGLTANEATPLAALAHQTHVLGCGKEDAVAATKSVVEQALFYDSLIRRLYGECMCRLDELADHVHEALTLQIDPELVKLFSRAGRIYFAGRNDGVAEELTLKTNEITRKSSDFLEGTYAVHGIEEVMDAGEVMVVIEPFESEEEKFESCLVKGVGMPVVAISTRQTRFPTILIPDQEKYARYIQLAAGWNLLVEIGLASGIDLDKPVRARKVGNEV